MSPRAATGGANASAPTPLTAAQPAAIVEQLLTMARQGEPGTEAAAPFATFMLRGAQDLSGWLIDAQGQPPALLVRLPDPQGRRPGDAVAYVDATHLAAIVIHDAAPWAARISGRKPPDAEAPGRMVIERRLGEAARALAKRAGTAIELAVDWSAIPDDDQGRWAVGELVDLTATALEAVAGDLAGKRALRAVASVLIAQAGANRVTLDGKALRIESPLAAPSAARFTAADLRSAIESCL